MPRPWTLLDAFDTAEGRLELRRRQGSREFLITVGGRVLMTTASRRSEEVLAEAACNAVAKRRGTRVLIGGLGMGYTLRAALDHLRRDARVVVAELHPQVVLWCRTPLAELTGHAVEDPRVEVVVDDVARVIAEAAGEETPREPFDAIALDLYEGPHAATQARDDPLYGPTALARTRTALTPGGVLAVWSEEADGRFEKRLASGGFRVERLRPKAGGPRHVVYLARPGGR